MDNKQFEIDTYLSQFHNDNKKQNVRVWSFIVWQDSCIPDWITYLKTLHIPCAISPLHDNDTWVDEQGIHSKPHWHVIINYSGKKSYEQVKEITDHINAGFPIRVGDIGGMTRYLIHLDDPDKHPYKKEDCISLGGYDLDFYFEVPKSKVKQFVQEICLFIENNNITSFYQITKFALYNNPDWFFVIMQCSTQSILNFVKSRSAFYADKEGKENEK